MALRKIILPYEDYSKCRVCEGTIPNHRQKIATSCKKACARIYRTAPQKYKIKVLLRIIKEMEKKNETNKL